MPIMKTCGARNNLPNGDGWAALRILLGGMLGMMVAMGIGRFVFTPVLPLMQRDLGMTHSVAGWLAGLNYLGYLAGAIVCSVYPRIIRNQFFAGSSLLLSLATTIFMAGTTSVLWWGGMRFIAGFVSAILFIVIVAEVNEALTRQGYSHWIGTLYGGVGLGIVLSGLLVPQFDKLGGWGPAWIGMGAVASFLALAGIFLGRKKEFIPPITVHKTNAKSEIKKLWILALAYFLEGFGYIVSATFIVAIVAVTPGLEGFAPYSWVAVGVAAALSTVFWPFVARRTSYKNALMWAYVIQATGIAISIYADTVVAVFFAAVAFGGTFLGIVALTLAEGTRRTGGKGKTAAILTACFGIGQVLGPIVAGVLADSKAGFTFPLFIAAISVGLGAVCTAFDIEFKK
ncbi:MAG: YbfB/YjiJ family MFS transporter [Desulfuromusa sp.]|nr:YbfB/YjiJ family MFS transporter [Desulfuromusa sp.]